MKRPLPPPETDEPLFDPHLPGKARTIYTIVAIVVVISMIVGIAGYAFWERVF